MVRSFQGLIAIMQQRESHIATGLHLDTVTLIGVEKQQIAQALTVTHALRHWIRLEHIAYGCIVASEH